MNALKCYWQVTAGMIPGKPDAKFARYFQITSGEWEKTAADKGYLMLSRWHEAVAYCTNLQLHSASGMEPNWVNIEYVWM